MNTEHQDRLTYLLDKLTINAVDKAEFDELFGLIRGNENEATIKAALLSSIENEVPGDVDRKRLDEVLERILGRETPLYVRDDKENDKGAKVQRLIKRIAVAASIILAVGVGTYFLFFNKTGKEIPHFVRDDKPQDVKAPETNRAMITLADGRVVPLDSISSGTLISQNGTTVIKTADGKIEYRSLTSLGMTKEVYNTLSNPRGSKVIDMTLSDGSHVWLNAGSSVTYPVAFVGNERKVSITGEAYFEIAASPNPSAGGALRPFIVEKGSMQVQVLGTHFNVNAYEDENDIKVTLLEGSVKVSSKQESLIIKPNQQAVSKVNGELSIVNSVNTEQVMAWKNGLFSFNRADIKTVMKELARWYDVEVVYEGGVPVMEFGGELQRNLNLSQVLRALEKSKVHFRIEGKKIVVMGK